MLKFIGRYVILGPFVVESPRIRHHLLSSEQVSGTYTNDQHVDVMTCATTPLFIDTHDGSQGRTTLRRLRFLTTVYNINHLTCTDRISHLGMSFASPLGTHMTQLLHLSTCMWVSSIIFDLDSDSESGSVCLPRFKRSNRAHLPKQPSWRATSGSTGEPYLGR